MKNIFVLLLISVGLYKAYGHFSRPTVEPLYQQPYLVVYGRDSCGYTKRTIKALQQAGVSYQYFSVDDAATADVLHSRMQNSGLETSRYLLPVVDLNNQLEIRPDVTELVSEAQALTL